MLDCYSKTITRLEEVSKTVTFCRCSQCKDEVEAGHGTLEWMTIYTMTMYVGEIKKSYPINGYFCSIKCLTLYLKNLVKQNK